MTRQNLVRFLLACLLLAMLVVPVVGQTFDAQAANDDSSFDFTLFQGEGMETAPSAVIACACGDPGGGQGSCC